MNGVTGRGILGSVASSVRRKAGEMLCGGVSND